MRHHTSDASVMKLGNDAYGHLILLAVDDLPHSEYAAEYCFRNVYKEGDTVAIMHVYPTTASKVSAFCTFFYFY